MSNSPLSRTQSVDPRFIDLSIIIVSWNVVDQLMDCLDSILENSIVQMLPKEQRLRLEVIVVDSASSDNTVKVVIRHFPTVKVLAQSDNIGFTRANNIGLAEAQGRYLLLLNPDTVILGNALGVMVKFLDENPDVGIVGPYTLNTDGTTQSTRRRFPSVAVGFFESTWLQPLAPRSTMDRYYVRDAPDIATLDVDWMQGSALMARRDVYEQIGGLDPGYVMYSEELDWCKRAKDAGWRIVYLSTAQIIHHGGKSSDRQTPAVNHINFQQSKLRYFRKYHGWTVAQLIRIFLLINYVVQLLVESVKGLLGHKREMRYERVRCYWQVLRSGLKVTS
jgi:GT2 family glycosyltransferase